MEPALVTDPKLMGVLEQLQSREPIFHRAELGTTRADFEKMMAADFWEVGASGRRYSRDSCCPNCRNAMPDHTWTSGKRGTSIAGV